MLPAFTLVLACQLVGETVVRVLALPLPGPVVGMVLLALLMTVRMPLPAGLTPVAEGLLQHLSLLFVPAGVGVVQHLGRIGHEGFRVLFVLVTSTAVTLAVTAVVFAAVARLMGVAAEPVRPEEDEP